MANRFPLIVDSVNLNIKELPSGDNLDLTGSDALLGDNDKIILGAGSDLQIYHEPNHSIINESGTGSLKIQGDNIRLQKTDGSENMITAVNDGAVTLFYDNAAKLATTSTGIDVTGTVEFDSLSGTGAVSITDILDEDSMASNSATALATQQSIKAYVDATVGATNEVVEDTTPQLGGDLASNGNDILFADNDKAIFGGGSDLEIYHESSTGRSFIKETGADEFRILGSNIRIKNGDDSKTYMQMTDGGSVAIRHNDGTKLETTSSGIDVTGGVAATDDSTFTAASGDIYVTASTGSGGGRAGYRVDETANNGFEMAHDNTDNAFFISRRSGSSTVVDALKIDRSTGDFSLFEDTGTTPKLFWDASAERLGIGNSSPATALDVTGTVTADGLTVDGSATIQATSSPAISVIDTTNNVEARLQAFNSTATVGTQSNHSFSIETNDTTRALFGSNGDVSLYEDTGTTPKFEWSASNERLVLSTSGAYALDVKASGTSSATMAQFSNSNGSDKAAIRLDANGDGELVLIDAGNNEDVVITAGGSSYFNGGSVGIGTSSPSAKLDIVSGTGYSDIAIEATGGFKVRGDGRVDVGEPTGANSLLSVQRPSGSSITGLAYLNDVNNSTGLQISTSSGAVNLSVIGSSAKLNLGNTGVQTQQVVLDTSSGNVNIATTSAYSGAKLSVNGSIVQANGTQHVIGTYGTSGLQLIGTAGGDNIVGTMGASEPLIFRTVSAERMRIDASGNLLVGTTDSSIETSSSTEGVNILPDKINVARSAGVTANFNRISTDGNIVQFRKDGSTVGSIGTAGGQFNIGLNTTSGLQFGTSIIYPRGTGNTTQDGTIDLGNSGNRFKDLYLSGDTYLSNGSNLKFKDSGGTSRDILTFDSSNDIVYAPAGAGVNNHIWKRNGSEKMRLDTSGNLLVGRTSNADSEFVQIGTATSSNTKARLAIVGYRNTNFYGRGIVFSAGGDNNAAACIFNNSSGTQVGSIITSASDTTYNTSSDQRLKENIVDAPSASDDIDAIQVRSFDWKTDGLHQKYGMVAQELVEVLPDVVYQPEDPEEMMGVDYSKLVPMMLKEIQSLRARVAELEEKAQ